MGFESFSAASKALFDFSYYAGFSAGSDHPRAVKRRYPNTLAMLRVDRSFSGASKALFWLFILLVLGSTGSSQGEVKMPCSTSLSWL